MAKTKITELTKELIAPFLVENGLELYDIEYVKEGHDWFLRIYIDKALEGGESEEESFVGIDDCELVSRFLSDKLDEADPIEQNYYLEVSSPGLERELKKKEDYERFAGENVLVSLYTPFEGKKKFEGTLISLENDILKIDAAGEELAIPFEKVSKVKLSIVF